MSLNHRSRVQQATYWKANGNTVSGEPVWDHPATIRVRWENREQTYIDDRGEQQIGSSVVFTDIQMHRGDYLFLGISEEMDAKQQEGSVAVKDTVCIPGLRGLRNEFRIVA